MLNIIAIIWDFDKTLVNGYMQDPIFKEYGVNASDFWKEVNSLPDKYLKEQKVKVNRDTIYLNQFIRYVREDKFPKLSNEKLRGYGAQQNFYAGIPDIFRTTTNLLEADPVCKEYNIRVEHYIVSTGFAEVIRGTSIMGFVKRIWGCELIQDKDKDGDLVISEIGYTIDNTSKTRALFEINKGIGENENVNGVTVNSKLTDAQRRVDFRNMIYIADGPSDVPAFSVVKGHGGATFAIYPPGDIKAFQQVEHLREDGRIDMFAEADYSDGKTASMWICNKIQEFANRIKAEEKAKRQAGNETPQHLV